LCFSESASFCASTITSRAPSSKRAMKYCRFAAVAAACVHPPRTRRRPGSRRRPSTIWWTRWCESSSASAISRSEPPAAWSFLIAWW
jgi:hypothetical protein